MRVLAVEEFASVMSTLMNYLNFLDLIYSSNEMKETVCTIHPRATRIRTNMNIHQLVDLLRSCRREYDLFHCSGWSGAIAAYMAEVPYGIHFHGSDIRGWRQSHSFWRCMCQLIEYRVLKQAKYVATSTPDLITYVRPVRSDSFYMPNPIDLQVFNRSVSKIRLERSPVFLSPHRLDRNKGHELIWKAISKTKNDFILLQPDWGLEPYWSRLKKDAPKKVEFIPLIPRSTIASYYISVDGVIGQMNLGVVGMSELEAAACGTPVFCYTNDSSPFLPKSKDPSILAKYIDNLIENRAFRQNLIGNELAYVKERYDAKMVSELWKEKWETIRVASTKTGRDIIVPNIWRKTYFLSHHITKLFTGYDF